MISLFTVTLLGLTMIWLVQKRRQAAQLQAIRVRAQRRRLNRGQ